MSSGGGGSTNVAQFKPPDYAVGGWQQFLDQGAQLTQQPYQQYYGMEIAPINNTQAQGMQMMANVAGNGAPDYNAARAANQITAMGGYENPYSTIQTENGVNPWLGAEAAAPEINRYRDAATQVGTNQFAGFSPDYAAFKQQSMDDVVKAYQAGTAAQTDSAFNRAGAFHGGGHDAQIASNEYGLGKNLQNMSSNMDFQQWQNSAGLQEADIARRLGASQTDLARNAALEQQAIGMVNQNQFANLDRNSQLGEAALNRGLTAQTNDLNRASQYWAQERQNQVGALPLAMQAQQNDLNNAKALTSVGDAQRQYQQDMLNAYKNNFTQYQQYPFQMLDAFGSILSRASGNYGSSTSQNTQNYQANPLAALIGGGLLGAGAYNAWGG